MGFPVSPAFQGEHPGVDCCERGWRQHPGPQHYGEGRLPAPPPEQSFLLSGFKGLS